MRPQTPLGEEKQANVGPTWVQKGVKKEQKSETLEKLKIELSLQRELSSAHEGAPQVELQNWVAQGKHRSEAQGAL